jgi:peptide-methionine (S)-S-oxide reductase
MIIRDTIFADAVAAIDAGDVARLDSLIAQNPRLITDRLETEEPGYFADPYLLWFVAENPIRNDSLPANIADVAMAIVDHIDQLNLGSRQAQLDYTVMLVATGRVPRESGVQLALIDALVARGASPAGLDSTVAHGEIDAAGRLIHHGAIITLAAAVCLGLWDDARKLIATASPAARADALMAAAGLGRTEAVRFLLDAGVDPNRPSEHIHAHSTALHQAALTGSRELCEMLVKAGASLTERDTMWNGTPAGWADHAGHKDLALFLRAAG